MSEIVKAIRQVTGGVVVDVVGELTLRESPAFHGSLIELCEPAPERLIINLREVTFIDSSGVGTLTDIYRRMRRQDKRMMLVGLNKMVRSVFEITRLDTLFSIYETEEEALSA